MNDKMREGMWRRASFRVWHDSLGDAVETEYGYDYESKMKKEHKLIFGVLP